MPVGMHRAQSSKWRSVAPFLILLIVIPLLGWGLARVLTNAGITPSQSDSTQSVAQSVAPPSGDVQSGEQADEKPEASGTGSTDTQVSGEETQSSGDEPTEEIIDKHVKIGVLNGTGIEGLAAEKSAALNEAGFPGTIAENAEGWVSDVSVVYYADPQIEKSAHEIARVLGIDEVRENFDDVGDYDVVVLLR